MTDDWMGEWEQEGRGKGLGTASRLQVWMAGRAVVPLIGKLGGREDSGEIITHI